jgi:hypothetical protein
MKVLTISRRYSSIRHTHITEELKKTISIKQAEITGAIKTTDKQLAEVEITLGELHVAGSGQERIQNTEDKDNALEQIEDERTALDSPRKLLQELLSKAREEAIAKAANESQNLSTQISFGTQNAGFQIGISNGPISGISFGGKGHESS